MEWLSRDRDTTPHYGGHSEDVEWFPRERRHNPYYRGHSEDVERLPRERRHNPHYRGHLEDVERLPRETQSQTTEVVRPSNLESKSETTDNHVLELQAVFTL